MAKATSPKNSRKPNASGDETKARIIAATLQTLKADGIVGTSARTIAKAGDFNQALIFYHFGSVNEAILAAVGQMSEVRIAKHRKMLAEATSLPELIQIARRLHDDDATNDSITVLTQAFAGASGDDDLGPRLYDQLAPWSDMVRDALDRIVGSAPGGSALPTEQIAHAISAMFLGIELLEDLDPSRHHAPAVFDSLNALAELLDDLLATPLLEMLLPDR